MATTSKWMKKRARALQDEHGVAYTFALRWLRENIEKVSAFRKEHGVEPDEAALAVWAMKPPEIMERLKEKADT